MFGASGNRLPGQLVAAGLWEPMEGGWQIHDYLDYNPSRDQVLEEREAQHQAKVRAGQASARARREGATGTAQPQGRWPNLRTDSEQTPNRLFGPLIGQRLRTHPNRLRTPSRPVPYPKEGMRISLLHFVPELTPLRRLKTAKSGHRHQLPTRTSWPAGGLPGQCRRHGPRSPLRQGRTWTAPHLRAPSVVMATSINWGSSSAAANAAGSWRAPLRASRSRLRRKVDAVRRWLLRRPDPSKSWGTG